MSGEKVFGVNCFDLVLLGLGSLGVGNGIIFIGQDLGFFKAMWWDFSPRGD